MPKKILSEDDAAAIRRDFATGEKQRVLAEQYQVSQVTISDVVQNKSHYNTFYTPPVTRRLPHETHMEIRELFYKGLGPKDVASQLGLSYQTVYHLFRKLKPELTDED